MHDVGKIAIPDAILQKPGKLTSEEFDIMKTHAARGGKIIRETFGHLGDDEYEKMAYEVARHHHEKWNGRGYPDGLSQKEIPLSARIMAVADVFDAVSAKRCYRLDFMKETYVLAEPHSIDDWLPCTKEVIPLHELDQKDFTFGATTAKLSSLQAGNFATAGKAWNAIQSTIGYINK